MKVENSANGSWSLHNRPKEARTREVGWGRLTRDEFEMIEDAASVSAPMTLEAVSLGLLKAGLNPEAKLVNGIAKDLHRIRHTAPLDKPKEAA